MADVQEAIANPHYWLAAYGVRSPYFCRLVAHGALNDIDPVDVQEDEGAQIPLLPGMEAAVREKRPERRLYRSRVPNKRDVIDREAIRYLPASWRVRLQNVWVLK